MALALDIAPARRSRRRRKGRPVRRFLVVTHRWSSLVLGIVLLAITTSGALILYQGEWAAATNRSTFHTTPTSDPVSFDDAVAVVDRAHPSFEAAGIHIYNGLFQVASSDDDKHPGFWGVDPGTGNITGYVNPDGGVMGFLTNLHECALTCDDYPGYVPFLDMPIPWASVHVIPEVTWGSGGILLIATMLFFLGISGLILWWPGVKRWTHGFRVRWRKTRFTRDFDLHQLIGFVAAPFLVMWGFTGASFELPAMENAWYALTGGVAKPDSDRDFSSHAAPKGTPDIGLAAAVAAAKAQSPGTVTSVEGPSEPGRAGSYEVRLSTHPDPRRHGPRPGRVVFAVDRHDATHIEQTSFAKQETWSNTVWDSWRSGVLHYGYGVNSWWRTIWFVFGMSPLLLAWTGVSTWLYRCGVAKRKRAAIKARNEDINEPND
ncbi:MAG: PepSY-associated TM helix domain-containing protein, partial [Aeromicrobium sp.]